MAQWMLKIDWEVVMSSSMTLMMTMALKVGLRTVEAVEEAGGGVGRLSRLRSQAQCFRPSAG